jgi:hypothetical protein
MKIVPSISNFYVKMAQLIMISRMNITSPCLQFQIIENTEDLRVPLNFKDYGFRITKFSK